MEQELRAKIAQEIREYKITHYEGNLPKEEQRINDLLEEIAQEVSPKEI